MRKRSVDEQAFLKAYETCENMVELSSKLRLGLPSAYRYCREMGLTPIRKTRLKRSEEIFDAFRGKATMDTLAEEFSMAPTTVRHHVVKTMVDKWRDPELLAEFPMPESIQLLKVIAELQDHPELFNDPEELSDRTNLPVPVIEEYLTEVYEAKRLRKKSKKSKRKKVTA